MTEEVVYRRAGPDDSDAIQLALYVAISWTKYPEIPPREVALAHPDIALYHEGWGRRGDIGVLALIDGEPIGAAFARRFTSADHGHGYVDDETPEFGIGVIAEHRGRGVGRRLMEELVNVARSAGVPRLSLSVYNPNPAKGLYESLGFHTVADNGESSIMVLNLD